jgi:cytochrome P450
MGHLDNYIEEAPLMDFDPFDRDHWDDPYPTYQALREQPTLHWAPGAEAFCVTRYEEAAEVFKQPELFSSRLGFDVLVRDRWSEVGPRDVFEMFRFLVRARVNPLALRGAPESIISSDPPHHGPLRLTVNRGFTPRRIDAWEPRVRELCAAYVRGIDEAERFDVVERLAHPLPMTIIAELLGVDADRIADFRRWSHGLISTLTGSGRSASPGALLANGGELLQYLRSVVERRRREPGDDLISVLVDPRQGEPLDTQAVLLFATILLVAGNETTTNAIGNSVQLLLDHSDVLDAVAADPSLVPAVVEESLRLESPFRLMPRLATRDTTIRNTRIPAGSRVLVMIGAANRDERRFPDAERFDLHRDTRGHLAFGHGIHFCLGASLARLEARVALETLIPLLRDRIAPRENAVRADSYFTRGFTQLEVRRRALTAAA